MFDSDFIINPYRAYSHLRAAAQKFSEPEELEISCDEGMPLSFSHGTHFCIGAALAYTEAEIAFTRLLKRTSGLKLLDVPAWRSNLSFRGLSRLPLSLSVRS